MLKVCALTTLLVGALLPWSPVDAGPLGTEYTGKYNELYTSVKIDCSNADVDHENTKDTIEVYLFNGSKRVAGPVIENRKSGLGWAHGIAPFPLFAPSLRTNTRSNTPSCTKAVDAEYVFFWVPEENSLAGYHGSIPDFDRVVIRTSGSDGFFIDEMEVYNQITKQRCLPPEKGGCLDTSIPDGTTAALQQWGTDGGNGYCLSTDPKDATRSWKDNVSGCYRELEFIIDTGKVYPSSKVSK